MMEPYVITRKAWHENKNLEILYVEDWKPGVKPDDIAKSQ